MVKSRTGRTMKMATETNVNHVTLAEAGPEPTAGTPQPDRDTLKTWFRIMHMGRVLDDKAPNYLKQAIGWSYHAPCAGHDGIQLALGLSFRASHDFLFPYYRDMLTCLAAGLTPLEILLNGISKAGDVAGGGRHMSNHFAKPAIGIQNVSSCTGNHTQHAVGLARAVKAYGSDAVVFSSQGESSTSEGYVYEAVNGANLEKVPVIFVVQDNGFGIAVPKSDQSANVDLCDNFKGFLNLKIIKCDGLDPVDSMRAMNEALAYVHSGAGPAMVYAHCVRIGSHSNSDKSCTAPPRSWPRRAGRTPCRGSGPTAWRTAWRRPNCWPSSSTTWRTTTRPRISPCAPRIRIPPASTTSCCPRPGPPAPRRLRRRRPPRSA